MAASAPLPLVTFREVRHFQPDDCLHYEPIHVRGQIHQWIIPAHRHDALHQFEMLERGSVMATIDGIRHTLTAPATWMVSPGSMHGFVYERNSAGHVVTVPTVTLREVLASLPQLEGRLEHPMVLRKRDIASDLGELKGLFAKLASEFQGRRPGRVEALKAHVILLGLWFVRRSVAKPASSRRNANDDGLVQRFQNQLERRFRARWAVADYAAALGVTPDHLSRRCRAIAGLGALDLVHERLMLEARRLLAYTPIPVTAIAHQLGFDDPAYFSRLFTNRCGQSPSAYRRSIAEGLSVRPSRSG